MQDQPSVQFTEAVVAPAFERRPDWWIYESLCRVMGLRSAFDGSTPPDLWARTDAMLRSRGHTMAQLRRDGVIMLERSRPEELFDTHIQHDDRRVDCCPEEFAEAIGRMHRLFDELQREPADQLKLITKRDAFMINSWYSNLPKLKRHDHDRNYLFMHPDDAAARRIRDGDTVSVSNRFGAIQAPVRTTDTLMPGVVAMTHGWGHAATPGMRVAHTTAGVNCNALLPSGESAYEPLSNQAHMTGIAVDVAVSAART
jgi:anaerobic selenocysteine-containing dehydrogenase